MSTSDARTGDWGKPHASLYLNSSIEFYCAAYVTEEHLRDISLNFAVMYNYSMAIELSLKAYLMHKKVSFKYNHNFREILESFKEFEFLKKRLSLKEMGRLDYLSYLHTRHLMRYPISGLYSAGGYYEDRLLASKMIGIMLAEFGLNFQRRLDKEALTIFKASNRNHLRLAKQQRKNPWQRLNRRIANELRDYYPKP